MNAAESDQLQITNILTYLMHHTDGHGDRETYLGYWTPDCTWESTVAGRWSGREGQQARHEHFGAKGIQGPGIDSYHVLTTIHVAVAGDDARALSTWLYIDRAPDGPVIRDLGTFDDTLRRVDGQWMIAVRRVNQGQGEWLGAARVPSGGD